LFPTETVQKRRLFEWGAKIVNRLAAFPKYSESISVSITNLLSKMAASPVDPEPANGSNTMSPGELNNWIRYCSKGTGFSVGCSRVPLLLEKFTMFGTHPLKNVSPFSCGNIAETFSATLVSAPRIPAKTASTTRCGRSSPEMVTVSNAARTAFSMMVTVLSATRTVSTKVFVSQAFTGMSALNVAFAPFTPTRTYSHALIIIVLRLMGTAFGLRQVRVRRTFKPAAVNALWKWDKYSSAQNMAKDPPLRSTRANSCAQTCNNDRKSCCSCESQPLSVSKR